MDDDRATLERVLRARAAEVPYLQVAPPMMLARARRRIVRNVLASALAVGIVVTVASVGVANLGALRTPEGVATGGPNGSSPPSTRPCTDADLRATAALDGAAGSVEGSIRFTNLGTVACALTGRPTVTLFRSVGHAVSVNVVEVAPRWRADGSSPPKGWPVVRLRPGDVAAIRVRWSNPCPQLVAPAQWRVRLPGDGGILDVLGADSTPPPPCNGQAEPSTLEIGPFEPDPGR